MLENKKIVFDKSWETSVHTEPIDEGNIPSGQVLLKKLYTIVSTGTELACLSGGESWFALPGDPGYACVGEIMGIGEGVEGFANGDRIFCYGTHSLYEMVPVEGIFMKVPREIDSKWVPFTRMASIAATAVRASCIEWGDFVAVTGQGLVGNMAVQLAKLQGAKTIAIDVADNRLALSRKCGADLVINSARQNAAEEIKKFTGGEMAGTLIEATGVPEVAAQAIEWVGQNGEMIFLGSPRGKYDTNLTAFLNHTHLAAFNVTLKGAHEWRYPVTRTPFVKHSLERNSGLILDLIHDGKLTLVDLLSEVAKPGDCQAVYIGLRDNKDKHMGVLFDWQ